MAKILTALAAAIGYVVIAGMLVAFGMYLRELGEKVKSFQSRWATANA